MSKNIRNWEEQGKLTTEEVLASKIMGKAITRQADGTYQIAVVFNTSTYYKFFYIFTARAARSPRKSWKFTGTRSVYQQGRVFGLADMAAELLRGMPEGTPAKYVYPVGKRTLAAIVDRIGNPFKNPSQPATLPAGASVELVNKRLENGRAGRFASLYNVRRR